MAHMDPNYNPNEDAPDEGNGFLPPVDRRIFLFDNREEVLGADIVQTLPFSMHFIAGVAFFDVNPSNPNLFVVDNRQFRQIINRYFQARLQDQAYIDTLKDSNGNTVLKVTSEIDGVLAMAKTEPIERLQGTESIYLPDRICIWKKVRSPDGSKNLKESNWRQCHFRDVSGDPKEVKKALCQPLRTELQKLYPPRKIPERQTSLPENKDLAPARELNESEAVLVQDIRTKINHPGSYVAALFTLRDDHQDADATLPANQYAAERIADSWLRYTKEGSKKKFVYRFDASDPGVLSASYTSQAQKLRHDHVDMPADAVQSQKVRLDQGAAANDFLTIFRSHFPRHCECLLIYTNVPRPDLFHQGFLPEGWLQDDHCRDTIRGVLLCTHHPEYTHKNGPPFGPDLAFRSIEWKPRDTGMGQACWWDRLPPSNLPYVSRDLQEPCGIETRLGIDGRAFAIVGNSPAVANQIATQAIRRWESEVSGRFAIWLDATNETQLKEAYQSAIRQVTFSSSAQPLGDPEKLTTRSMADALMALLALKRTLSKRDHRWALIFANDTSGEDFHLKFCSADSNWWNSRGRFIVITSSPCVKVEIDINGEAVRTALPSIPCPEEVEGLMIEELRAATISGATTTSSRTTSPVPAAAVADAAASAPSHVYDQYTQDIDIMRDHRGCVMAQDDDDDVDMRISDHHHQQRQDYNNNGVRHNVMMNAPTPYNTKKRKAQIFEMFYQQLLLPADNTTNNSCHNFPTKPAPAAQSRYAI